MSETTKTPEAPPADEPGGSLDLLMDVPLEVTAELLALSKGSVIELEKAAGAPLDVRVNGQLVARGEAVVIQEKFGVRLTDIVSRSERVQGLS
jgi:flagellar motor switch protein FliN/FliY